MPKATIQTILAEGFQPEQFGFNSGATTGWNDSGGYLDLLVVEAGFWAEAKVGAAVYAAVADPSYANNCLRQAETCYVSALLFKRRIKFFDGSANMGLKSPLYAERRGYAADADRASICAESFLAEAQRALGVDVTDNIPGIGASLAVVESGRYALTSGTV